MASRWTLLVACWMLSNACSTATFQDAAVPDAASRDAGMPSSGGSGARDAAPLDAADSDVRPPMGSVRFDAITLETSPCTPARPGLSIRSSRRVLVTTGCGFYAVDPLRGVLTQLEAAGQTLADDGNTVAVIADRLGLSLDAGETFAWTSWTLGRCQGVPQLCAGDGFAIVTCVAGSGRWRAAGSAFEPLQPGGAAAILPVGAARGAHLVINQSDGWFQSNDRGDSFAPWRVEGLPDGADLFAMEIVGSRLFVPAPSDAAASASDVVLFAAPLGSGVFERVASFPATSGRLRLGYNAGTLVVIGGGPLLLSSDDGATFSELQAEGLPVGDAIAKYAAGHIYVVVDGALFVSR